MILYLLSVIAILTFVNTSSAASTGIWIDDGYGQTVKAELPPYDAKVLRQNMLDLFGLPEPHRRRHHHKPHGSAPNYMKNLYQEIDERGHAPRLDPQHRVVVDAADAIMTFATKVPSQTPSRNLNFNMDDVPLEMILLGTELQVHRSKPAAESKEDMFLRVILINQDMSETVIGKSMLRTEGWIGLNVTAAFLSWVINPPSNKGLRLSVRKANQKHEEHLVDGGITGSHGEVDFRPFLVGYFSKSSEEARYEVNEVKIRKVREARPLTTDFKRDYGSFVKHISVHNTQCQKKGLHVSFKEIGWHEWVIFPEEYHANYCDGTCKFPLLAHTNATNHAVIQTLIKTRQAVDNLDDLPPDACCAPRDLSMMSVLYYDYSNNIVLKKFRKMIVKTCGCI